MAHNPLPAVFVHFSYVFSQYENWFGWEQNTYTTRREIHTKNTYEIRRVNFTNKNIFYQLPKSTHTHPFSYANFKPTTFHTNITDRVTPIEKEWLETNAAPLVPLRLLSLWLKIKTTASGFPPGKDAIGEKGMKWID